MKKQGMFLLLCSLSIGCVWGQESNPDSTRLKTEQNELKESLANIDGQLEVCQQTYYAAQTKKVSYDTVGLGQFRYEMAQLKEQKKQQEIVFIKKHPNYLVSLEALNDVIGAIPADIEQYRQLFEGLSQEVQNSEVGQKTKKTINRYMAVRIGAEAPLFSAPDTAGKEIKLSDFRGKYVLLDFWASWCVPCREENPLVVKAYQQFKDKNFEILSVSLDQPGKQEAWLKAIHDDRLDWAHVSDLKFWNNAVAQLYAVRSIPQNFLIDPEGKIIAANLRGENLERTLTDLLNN